MLNKNNLNRKALIKGLLHSIYLAHEGEGINIGIPQIFIRFQGCNLGCQNCDSQETWSWNRGSEFSLEQVLMKIWQINKYQNLVSYRPRISITGGDPLHLRHRPFVHQLCKLLKKNNYFVSLEASGNIIDEEIFFLIDFINFDFKTPSTGVKTNLKQVEKLFTLNFKEFQIKSVIENERDYFYVLAAWHNLKQFFVQRVKQMPVFTWCLTPAFNPRESNQIFAKRFRWLLEINRHNAFFKVIAQQHKWAYLSTLEAGQANR